MESTLMTFDHDEINRLIIQKLLNDLKNHSNMLPKN